MAQAPAAHSGAGGEAGGGGLGAVEGPLFTGRG